MWGKTCLVCHSINTATNFKTDASRDTFKIQSGTLNCDSNKSVAKFLTLGKQKTKIRYRFNNYKSKHNAQVKTFKNSIISGFFPNFTCNTMIADDLYIR